MMRNAAFTMAIPGQAFAVEATAINLGSGAVTLDSVALVPAENKDWAVEQQGSPSHDLGPGKQAMWRMAVKVPADAPPTRPYYKRDSLDQPYYDLLDERYRNL